MAKKPRTPFAADTDWTRSFPSGTVDGQDWMVAVLDDLHAYAITHDMTEIADNLVETRRTLLAHLQRRKH